MVLGIIELFHPGDEALVPFFIPIGLIGLGRLLVFAFRLASYLLYRPERPRSSSSAYTSRDVTIIVPTIDCGPEFGRAAIQWLKNAPAEIIVVTTHSCLADIQSMVYAVDKGSGMFRVLSVPVANKRIQLVEGINAARTEILALSDDDAIWSDDFIKWMLAPFENPRMGGVGSGQAMIPVGGKATLWEILADMRLSMRMMEAASTSYVDGGISCLSGRTAVYRREILVDSALQESFVNERWLNKYYLHSGDDKFLTRWLVSHDWEMSFQMHKDAMLLTTFKPNWHFLKQLLRWTRNTWRSDFRSLFIDRQIWRRYPCVAFNMLDKMINPATLLLGPALIGYAMFHHSRWSPYAILASEVVWVVFSRYIRLYEHWRRRQWDIIHLPLYILFNYFFALMKIYALFTLHVTGWATRSDETLDVEESVTSISIIVEQGDEIGPTLIRKVSPLSISKTETKSKMAPTPRHEGALMQPAPAA